MRMATRPSHSPFVGLALKSQGQPNAQLQFLSHSPSNLQSADAMISSLDRSKTGPGTIPRKNVDEYRPGALMVFGFEFSVTGGERPPS
jgi:hypothetical protein